MLKKFFTKHIAPILEQLDVNLKQFTAEFGPEKYTEETLGKLTEYSCISGGGLFSSVKSEVEVSNSKYLVRGALNAESKGSDVILRHWPKTVPHNKTLIINGNKYRVVEN